MAKLQEKIRVLEEGMADYRTLMDDFMVSTIVTNHAVLLCWHMSFEIFV